MMGYHICSLSHLKSKCLIAGSCSVVSVFLITICLFLSQDTVSVHRPGFYAERFQQFMCNTVFKKIPREYASLFVLRFKPFCVKIPA